MVKSKKTKAKKSRKPKKPTEVLCCGCFKMFPLEETARNENGSVRCFGCLPPKTRKKKEAPTFGWYVLAVMPGEDGRVRKDLIRRSKIENLTDKIKRVFSPKKFEEMVVSKPGQLVEEGRATSMREAHIVAQRKCRELSGRVEGEKGPDGADATPGYRYTLHRAPGKEKGKEGNDYVWKIKTVNHNHERKVLQIRKYPGYLLCQMDYTPEVANLLKKVRGHWGLLLPPIIVGHLIEVKYQKRYGTWAWKVREPESRKIVASGKGYTEERTARSAAETEKDRLEEFKPIALATQEAAEELIAQKAVNQIAKDKEERDKAKLKFRIGSLVRIKGGAFRNVEGKVVTIDKTEPNQPLAVIEAVILNTKLPVSVPHFEVECIKF